MDTIVKQYAEAVVILYTFAGSAKPQERNLHNEATAFCARVEDDVANGYRVQLATLTSTSQTLADSTNRTQVKFHCLTKLQQTLANEQMWYSHGAEQRREVIATLMGWMNQRVREEIDAEPKYIRAKLGVVMASLLRREYNASNGGVWYPNAMDELIDLATTHGGYDVLLFILLSLDEEVIALRLPEANEIKDLMRARAIPRLVTIWATILYNHQQRRGNSTNPVVALVINGNLTSAEQQQQQQRFAQLLAGNSSLTPAPSRPPSPVSSASSASFATSSTPIVVAEEQDEVARRCLACIGAFVSWCDVTLVAEERFLSLVLAEAFQSPSAPVTTAAISCLTRILKKGMDFHNKWRLIESVGFPDLALALTCLPPPPHANHSVLRYFYTLWGHELRGPSSGEALFTSMLHRRHHHHQQQQQDARSIVSNFLLGILPPGVSPDFAVEYFSHHREHLISANPSEEYEELGMEVARLVDCLGIEILEVRKRAAAAGGGDAASAMVRGELGITVDALCSILLSTQSFKIRGYCLEFANQVAASTPALPPGGDVGGGGGEHLVLINKLLLGAYCSTRKATRTASRLASGGVGTDETLGMEEGGEEEENEEEEFEEHRRSTKRLFLNLARAHLGGTLNFLFALATATCGPPAEQAPPSREDLEAFLVLLHNVGEALPGGSTQALPEFQAAAFEDVLAAAFASPRLEMECAADERGSLATTFNEVVARYLVQALGRELFPSSQQPRPATTATTTTSSSRLTGDLMVSMLRRMGGRGGVHHPTSPAVRSRACQLLLRMVKAWHSQARGGGGGGNMKRLETGGEVVEGSSPLGPGLGALANPVVGAVSGVLDLSLAASSNRRRSRHHHRGFLNVGDTMALFETVGLVLGGSSSGVLLSEADHLALLASVVNPIKTNMEEAYEKMCALTRAKLGTTTSSSPPPGGETTTTASPSSSLDTPEDLSRWKNLQVEALAVFVKGFHPSPPPARDPAYAVLKSMFESCVWISSKFNEVSLALASSGGGGSTSLRTSTRRGMSSSVVSPPPTLTTTASFSHATSSTGSFRRLCHTMINNDVLGKDILGYFPALLGILTSPLPPWEAEEHGANALTALFQVLNQLAAQFKSRMAGEMNAALFSILSFANSRISPVANRVGGLDGDDRLELIAMERELFTYLYALVGNELGAIFTSRENLPYLFEILGLLAQGMESIPEAAVQRMCVSTMHALLRLWTAERGGGADGGVVTSSETVLLLVPDPLVAGITPHQAEEVRAQLARFFFERATPASFHATAQPHFDPKDAGCTTLLVSVCGFHQLLYQRFGETWLNHVARAFLPSVNCPTNVAEEYCRAVVTARSSKELKDVFKRLFLSPGASIASSSSSSSSASAATTTA